MIYRVVNAECMEQVRQLWDYCFEKEQEPFFQYYFNEYCGKDNMVIGGFDSVGESERLRTMLHVNPYTLRLRGREQLIPYLVGIATAPEARGQHLLAPLLQTAFEMLRSEGLAFATLMPIYAGIYLPYEFAYCYYRQQYRLPLDALGRELSRAAGRELVVEHVPLARELLAPLYEELTAAYNGVPLRTDFQWNKLLKVHALEGMQCAVVYREGAPCGYMLYYLADDCFTIHELLCDAQDARSRLLQYAAMHQSSAKQFSWLAEAWDKTYLGFGDQGLSGSLAPFMMARCLDAHKALAQLQVPQDMPEGSLVLLLTDKIIERNNHLLRLAAAPGSLNISSTLDEEQVIMDMGAFTQLYFGAFSAGELFEAGRIRISGEQGEKALTLLDRLLPKERNYINEYF